MILHKVEGNINRYCVAEDVYNKHAVENIESERVPNVVAENPLDKLDCKFYLIVVLSLINFYV